MDLIKKYLYYGVLGLFAYMPFHILISQWASTFTGGLEVWKIWKDVFTAILVSCLVVIILWRRLYTRTYLVLLGLSIIYLVLHIILFVGTNQPAETGFLGTTYNNRVMWFVLIGYSLALIRPERPLAREFAKVLVAVATVVALIGFAQWLLPKDIMTHFGYSVERGVKPNFFIDDKPDLPRVFSTLRDPNSLGAFLILPSTLVFVYLIRGWNSSRRLIFLGLQALFGLVVLLTFSRSAWVGLFISHGVATVYLYKDKLLLFLRHFAVPVVVVLVLLSLGGFFARDQYVVKNVVLHEDQSTKQVGSNGLHVKYIQKGIRGIIADPEGHGPGTAGIVSTKLKNGLLTENYFVQIGYEVGLFGLLVLIVFVGVIANNLLINHRDLTSLALLSSLAGLIFINMLLHAWSNEAVATSWFLLAGLTIYNDKKDGNYT